MSLNLRQMEVLRALYRAQSVTGAAKSLNVTQPGISRMLKHIEATLGFQLFHRQGGRLVPTQQAEQLEDSLDTLFTSVHAANRLVGDMQKGFGQTVRIGAMPTLANTLLPEAIAAVGQLAPKLRFVIKASEPTPMERRVESGDFAFALTQTPPRRAGIQMTVLCHTTYVCLLPIDHRLAPRLKIDPAELADEKMVSFSERVVHGVALDDAFNAQDSERRVGVQTTSSAFALRLVENGFGVALVDPFCLDRLDSTAVVARPMVERLPLALGYISAEGRRFDRSETMLLDAIGDSVAAWKTRVMANWGSSFFPPEPVDP